MIKLRISVIVIFFFIFLSPAFAGDSSTAVSSVQDDIIKSQLENLNLSELQKEINKINREIERYLPDFDLKELAGKLLKGDSDFSFLDLIRAFFSYLGKEISANISLLGRIIVLAVLSAVLSIFHQSFSSKTISDTANMLVFLLISVLIIQAFRLAVQTAIETLDNMVLFIQALLPVLLSLLISLGALSSAAVFQPLTFLMITAISSVIRYTVFPLIFLAMVMSIVTKINENISLSRLASLFKEIGISILGLAMTSFIGALLLQGGVAAVTDSISLRTAKYLTGNFVPVIGKIFADAVELIAGCSLILKNAVSIAGMLIIIIIISFPLIKIISLIFVYKLTAAVIQPVADQRLVEILNDTGSGLIMVFLVLSAVSIMFFIAITIIAGVANITVMMR
ncbi:MAG: stage III sporulation protein AE [Halanaerobiaceae bacterium]|jgi:stage III sporulation protein AE|nr:stage III sporulation protein AE [Halanaerobiaceae bacterium]